MTDLVYDALVNGIDMMLMASLFAATLVLLRSSTILLSVNASQQTNAERITYYKEYAIYDNKDNLTSADALSCIVYYKGSIPVSIQTKDSNGDIKYHYYSLLDTLTGKYRYAKADYDGSAWVNARWIEYDDLRKELQADKTFSSNIYENMSANPSEYYTGGTITRIVLIEN